MCFYDGHKRHCFCHFHKPQSFKKKKAEESKEIFNSCICFVYFCLAKKEVEFAKGKDEGMGGV